MVPSALPNYVWEALTCWQEPPVQRGGRVILTLQLPPLAQGFPSQGPGPGLRHPGLPRDGPLGQLLAETGTSQRGPVQPSRHRHSSGCSQYPCWGLQPGWQTAVGGEKRESGGEDTWTTWHHLPQGPATVYIRGSQFMDKETSQERGGGVCL